MVSTEAVLDVVDSTVSAVEDTVDTLERVPHLALNGTTRKQQIIILTAVAASAAVAGGAVSHLVTRKVLRLKFEANLEEQLASARRHYTVMQEKPSPLDLVADSAATDETQQYQEHVNEYNGAPRPDKPSVVETADGTLVTTEGSADDIVSVFSDSTVIGQWNQKVEESKRSPDEPYVISKDEYFEGVLDHHQDILTYYEGDETLANADDSAVPVHEVDTMVGETNLLRFGHGSEDPNVVYVRNERLEIDFEIVRSNGKYSVEVAGFGDPGV